MLENRKSCIKKTNVNFPFELSQNCSKANGNVEDLKIDKKRYFENQVDIIYQFVKNIE